MDCVSQANALMLIVGIDKLATETQVSEGWAYFMLPKVQVADFARDIKALLSQKFKEHQAWEYIVPMRLLHSNYAPQNYNNQ